MGRRGVRRVRRRARRAILAKPAARARQIEFIGDSLTAGYGNLSDHPRLLGERRVNRTTNTDLSFGALTAKALNADYQINAFSGRGMVRNYNGGEPGTSYRTYYDRALLHVDGDVWQNPGTWRPQLVVVGLGINDFSTAINPGEPWTPESLRHRVQVRVPGLPRQAPRPVRHRHDDRRERHPSASGTFADAAQQVVQDRNARATAGSATGTTTIRRWTASAATGTSRHATTG